MNVNLTIDWYDDYIIRPTKALIMDFKCTEWNCIYILLWQHSKSHWCASSITDGGNWLSICGITLWGIRITTDFYR